METTITEEQWLREINLRNFIRESNVIIHKLCSARIAYVDANYLEYLTDYNPDYIKSFTFEEIHNQLIKLCWSEVSYRTKNMTIKYMWFDDNQKYYEYFKPSKHTRKLK